MKRNRTSISEAKFVANNEGLIIRVINKYFSYYKQSELQDMLQAGRMGLVLAYRKYDPNKGAISNIATWQIRGAIHTYLRHTLKLTGQLGDKSAHFCSKDFQAIEPQSMHHISTEKEIDSVCGRLDKGFADLETMEIIRKLFDSDCLTSEDKTFVKKCFKLEGRIPPGPTEWREQKLEIIFEKIRKQLDVPTIKSTSNTRYSFAISRRESL